MSAVLSKNTEIHGGKFITQGSERKDKKTQNFIKVFITTISYHRIFTHIYLLNINTGYLCVWGILVLVGDFTLFFYFYLFFSI